MNRYNSLHNIGFDRQQLNNLDDLDASILLVLSNCVGRENAMTKREITRYLKDNPKHKRVNERQFRAAIQRIRQSGTALVLSTGGRNGGYWIAKDRLELEAFFEAELDARAFDLLETKSAMTRAAERLLGDKPVQRGLL